MVAIPGVSFQSGELGVDQGVTSATVLRELSLFPASLFVSVAGVPAIGLGHALRLATCGRLTVAFDPSSLRPVALASFAICEPIALPTVGLGQAASGTIIAASCGNAPPA